MNVIITGAGRGIGLALVNEFLLDKNVETVYACSRSLSAFEKHPELNGRLQCVFLDLTCQNSIQIC